MSVTQISIEPKDDLQVYRDKKLATIENLKPVTVAPPEQPFASEIDDVLADNQGQFSLNRILKRKFTELEEITERLRARLLDVTDDSDELDKDMEDEFESDLNTQPDEDGDDWSFVDETESMAGTSQNSLHMIAQSIGTSELKKAVTATVTSSASDTKTPEAAAP